MKDSAMSLTTQDLTAIKDLLNDHTETNIRPMVHGIVNAAIDKFAITVGESFNEVTLRFDKVEADISEIRADVAELKTDVAILKVDVTELKTDVAILKVDVTELKTDVAELKTDVAELKTDVAELKTDMREVKWGLADSVRRPEFSDLRDRVIRLEHQTNSN
jgi:chromosome segregation ATPase